MRKKIILCLMTIIMIIPFICNYTYAAENSIRSKLFFDDINSDGRTVGFWSFDAGQYSDSSDLLKRVKEAEKNEEYEEPLGVMVDFILWVKNQNYQTLASENDENYLEMAKIALKTGEKLLVENGNIKDGEIKDEKILFVLTQYNNDNFIGENGEAAKVCKELYYDIEKQMQRVNAAYDYKDSNSTINASASDKAKYTQQQVKQYLQKYGNRCNLENNTTNNNIKKAWAEGVSTSDSLMKKLSYNAQQIKAYFKIAGERNAFNNSNDTLIKEWGSIIGKDGSGSGEHTVWYNNNVSNGELRTGKWNDDFSSAEEKNETIKRIREFCRVDWTEEEINSAKQKLTEIAESGLEASFRTNTGYSMDDAADKSGESSRSDEAKNHSIKEKYTLPEKIGSTNGDKDATDLDTIIDSADSFINSGTDNKISEENLQKLSESIYSILLIVGVIVAVIIGAILGIRFMTGSVEQQADVKKLLVPYIAGCVVVFGAFGIWKIAVTIIASI
ncbi:MAG: hypothetical protein IJJ82_04935 [Clostridia bacterium]|nr:hypothetical protein [Clostridia bacterium]